jgi:hypothetical protein
MYDENAKIFPLNLVPRCFIYFLPYRTELKVVFMIYI